jgi:hypothetical protein
MMIDTICAIGHAGFQIEDFIFVAKIFPQGRAAPQP